MSDFEEGFEAFLLGDENKIDSSKTVVRNGRDGFQCPNCNRSFTLASNLTRHMRHNKVCGISKGFECSNCHKLFSLNATMKDHYLRCVAEDPYRFSCPYCPKQFTFKSSLNKHLRGRCRSLKKQPQVPKNVDIYACRSCAAEFYDANICKKHEANCTTENEAETFVCPHCAKLFTMKSSLTKHLKGRCKTKKSKVHIELDSQPKIECVFQNSTTEIDNDANEVEVWLELDDVKDEIEDDVLENAIDLVESCGEISDHSKEDDTEKFTCDSDQDY